MGTIGTGPAVAVAARRASSRSTVASWSGWMSNSTRLGRAGPPVSRSVRSRLYCTRNSVPSRKAPKPMASTTVAVWFDGPVQVGEALPPHVGPARREASGARRGSAPTTRPRAPAGPRRRRRRRSRPGASSPPGARPAPRCSPPAPPRPRAATDRSGGRRSGSTSRRSAASGGTRRTASSGSSAKTSATQSPIPSPSATARERDRRPHVHRQQAGEERRAAAAAPAPRAAAPSDAAGQPHRRRLGGVDREHPRRALAPRQRSTAMVSSRWRMNTTTALATPMPPSSSAMSADQPEVAGEPAERVVQVRAGPRPRCGRAPARAGARAGSARRAPAGETAGRQPHERLVLGARAEAQQAGRRRDRAAAM